MMQFIYASTIIALLLFVVSFIFKNEILASLACMMLIVLGVSILPDGFFSINNYLTQTIGYILILLGSFMLINISMDVIDGGTANG